MKKIAISAAIIAGLIAPAASVAAEVPQLPTTSEAANVNATANTSGVTTEPMKVVKVKASKKSPAKKKQAAKKTKKKTSKKRVHRSMVRK
jgi:hypothetical protein